MRRARPVPRGKKPLRSRGEALPMKDIIVRPLAKPAEFVGAEEVQLSAWGENERAVTPKEIMIAVHDNGGVVLGAFEGRKTVGFAILLPGYNGKDVYMYSHMTGVLKEYQSRGVGYMLKQKRARVCTCPWLRPHCLDLRPHDSAERALQLRQVGRGLQELHSRLLRPHERPRQSRAAHGQVPGRVVRSSPGGSGRSAPTPRNPSQPRTP